MVLCILLVQLNETADLIRLSAVARPNGEGHAPTGRSAVWHPSSGWYGIRCSRVKEVDDCKGVTGVRVSVFSISTSAAPTECICEPVRGFCGQSSSIRDFYAYVSRNVRLDEGCGPIFSKSHSGGCCIKSNRTTWAGEGVAKLRSQLLPTRVQCRSKRQTQRELYPAALRETHTPKIRPKSVAVTVPVGMTSHTTQTGAACTQLYMTMRPIPNLKLPDSTPPTQFSSQSSSPQPLPHKQPSPP